MGLPNSKSRLSDKDIEYLKNNTKFSEKEIRKWYKGFMKECKSGHLTKEQFLEVYKGLFPSGDAEKFCMHVFRTFDSDNSGSIDFKEFLLAISVTSKGTPEQKLEFAFRMYDIDSSGSIEEKEMVKVVEAIYEMLGCDVEISKRSQMAREKAKLIFERLDLNRDEQLSSEEFVKGCLSDEEVFNLLANMNRKS